MDVLTTKGVARVWLSWCLLRQYTPGDVGGLQLRAGAGQDARAGDEGEGRHGRGKR